MANNLLQYSAGRILASELGADLEFAEADAWVRWFPQMSFHRIDQNIDERVRPRPDGEESTRLHRQVETDTIDRDGQQLSKSDSDRNPKMIPNLAPDHDSDPDPGPGPCPRWNQAQPQWLVTQMRPNGAQ